MPQCSRGLALSLVALLSVPFANAGRVTNTSEQVKTARQVIVASETAMKDVKSFHVVGMVGANPGFVVQSQPVCDRRWGRGLGAGCHT